MRRVYKGNINRDCLPDNGVFVFGSNTVCINGNPRRKTGGAALVAHTEFGVGLNECMNNCLSKSGKAYGLVTVRAPKKYIPLQEITENIKLLYDFALENSDKLFFVAYDGKDPNAVSLNGKTRKQLANCFSSAGEIPENIIFEENFYKLVLMYK